MADIFCHWFSSAVLDICDYFKYKGIQIKILFISKAADYTAVFLLPICMDRIYIFVQYLQICFLILPKTIEIVMKNWYIIIDNICTKGCFLYGRLKGKTLSTASAVFGTQGFKL